MKRTFHLKLCWNEVGWYELSHGNACMLWFNITLYPLGCIVIERVKIVISEKKNKLFSVNFSQSSSWKYARIWIKSVRPVCNTERNPIQEMLDDLLNMLWSFHYPMSEIRVTNLKPYSFFSLMTMHPMLYICMCTCLSFRMKSTLLIFSSLLLHEHTYVWYEVLRIPSLIVEHNMNCIWYKMQWWYWKICNHNGNDTLQCLKDRVRRPSSYELLLLWLAYYSTHTSCTCKKEQYKHKLFTHLICENREIHLHSIIIDRFWHFFLRNKFFFQYWF